MARSRRPSFKGHCVMCAMNTDGNVVGAPWAWRLKVSEQRKFGRDRRIGRHEIPADQRADRFGRVIRSDPRRIDVDG